MEIRLHTAWVMYIHQKMDGVYDTGKDCPNCAPFKDKDKYTWEYRANYHWGMCDEHISYAKGLLEEDVKIHIDLEKALGLTTPVDFDRYLPNGKFCTMRSPLWCAYLLELAEHKE